MCTLGLNKCWTGPRRSVATTSASIVPTPHDDSSDLSRSSIISTPHDDSSDLSRSIIPITYDDSFDLSRRSFPKGFVFGTSSSNYQVRFTTLRVLLCMCKYA